MSKPKKSFGALSFPKPSLNGFIRNVEKQLDKFHHDEARSIRTAYLYAIFLGMFGAHHFYLGRYMFGFMYLFTFGLCGIGYVADLFRIRPMVNEANMRIKGEETRRSLFETYLLWFPFGILGFHYIYLKDYMMAILYLLTGGVYGIAWLFDAVRIPNLVANFNGETYFEQDTISLVHAYLFSLPPFGILGAHQYYCGRKYWGLFYTFTLAGLGFGWLMDFLRMPFLVSRAEDKSNGKTQVMYHKDDVYMLWLSFGLIGAHHFYLRRYRWGIIYLVTLGGLGFGWMIDLFRIPSIVNELNLQLEQEMDIANVIGMADKRIFSVPPAHDSDSVLPFDDVIHNHHINSSPRVLPKMTREFVNEAFGGSPASPRRAGTLGQGPHKKIPIDPDSPMFCVRRTLTSESNSIHTVHVADSPRNVSHCEKSATAQHGIRDEKDTSIICRGNEPNGGIHNKVGKRKSKHSSHTVQVDVHVHGSNTSENNRKDSCLERKSSITLGHVIQTNDLEDANNETNGIASVDINRTPTIRVKTTENLPSRSNSSISVDTTNSDHTALVANRKRSVRKSVSEHRRKRKSRKESKDAIESIGIDSPRLTADLGGDVETPRGGLFPGSDPSNSVQNDYFS